MKADQLNQLNNMINNMNNINICDAQCQKAKKIDRLRLQYNNARNRKQNAPAEVEATRKAYFVEDKGTQYYNQYMENEYKKEAQKEVADWNKTIINPLVNQINEKLSYYTSQKYYQNNVKDLYDYHKNTLEDLEEKVENTNAKKYTNDRLAYYYDYNTGIVNSFNNTMFYLYWILVGIAILLFFYKKQFYNASYYPFIVLILVTPFAMNKIYELAFSNIKHAKVNNLFFIYFVIIISLFFIFNFLSNLPFTNNSQPA
tara:strand:+ start:4614 stop:5384 length:771 start_codon:yes stop_codon:yes gene_type:complete